MQKIKKFYNYKISINYFNSRYKIKFINYPIKMFYINSLMIRGKKLYKIINQKYKLKIQNNYNYQKIMKICNQRLKLKINSKLNSMIKS